MTDYRRNIKVNGETFDELEAEKRPGESWDALSRRLLAALEADDGTLSEADKRDLAQRTADEIEARLGRR